MNLDAPRYVGPTYATPLPEALAKSQRVRPLVVCVYWGDKYPLNYVRKLKSAVSSNLRPHDFLCVTANPRVAEMGVQTVTPHVSFEGWWQKVGLFAPGLLGEPRPVLYLDLDVVITGSLDPLLEFEIPQYGLLMAENFGPNKPQAAHNSSVMVWVAGDCDDIATEFDPAYMKALHGDQCYLWRKKTGRIDNFPRSLVRSYKYDCTSGVPENCRVVVFHGKPDPHEVRAPWVDAHWHQL